jgi:hypothetical protein
MNDTDPPSPPAEFPGRPAKKGKLAGPKPPLRPGHVWSIRAKLQLERRVHDLALFNLAIDSKLRDCDLVAREDRCHALTLRDFMGLSLQPLFGATSGAKKLTEPWAHRRRFDALLLLPSRRQLRGAT